MTIATAAAAAGVAGDSEMPNTTSPYNEWCGQRTEIYRAFLLLRLDILDWTHSYVYG